MAEYLASIFGTEKDKVNCSFYFKIGACRHGDRCSRMHNRPTYGQTILLQNLFLNPQHATTTQKMTDMEVQEYFDNFFEEVFAELEDRYGEIEEMNVCDNLGDHLVGNIYVKFRYERHAARAVQKLNTRWFNGRPIHAEMSPVTDFREACCRQYEMGECTRGGFCNFMHLKPISRELKRELYTRLNHRSKRRSAGYTIIAGSKHCEHARVSVGLVPLTLKFQFSIHINNFELTRDPFSSLNSTTRRHHHRHRDHVPL